MAKWAGTPEGAIAAGVADMELGTPPFVVDAVVAEARSGGGYASPQQLQRPVVAAAKWWRRHGLVMDTERCILVGSVTATIAFARVRTSQPGDGVVRIRPTYPPLVDAIAAQRPPRRARRRDQQAASIVARVTALMGQQA